MAIRLELSSSLINNTGASKSLAMEASNVGELVDQVCQQFPKLEKRLLDGSGKLFPYLVLLHNESKVSGVDLTSISLNDGDVVEIMTLAGGG